MKGLAMLHVSMNEYAKMYDSPICLRRKSPNKPKIAPMPLLRKDPSCPELVRAWNKYEKSLAVASAHEELLKSFPTRANAWIQRTVESYDTLRSLHFERDDSFVLSQKRTRYSRYFVPIEDCIVADRVAALNALYQKSLDRARKILRQPSKDLPIVSKKAAVCMRTLRTTVAKLRGFVEQFSRCCDEMEQKEKELKRLPGYKILDELLPRVACISDFDTSKAQSAKRLFNSGCPPDFIRKKEADKKKNQS